MKRKRTKSVIATILAAVLSLTIVCPAMGAEPAAELAATIEAAELEAVVETAELEAAIEVAVETEESSETNDSKQEGVDGEGAGDENETEVVPLDEPSTDLSEATVTIPPATYNGRTQQAKANVILNDETLIENTDYVIENGNATDPGSYQVTINGIGSYTGTVTGTFLILPGKTTRGDMFNLAGNVKVTWKEVPGAKYYKVYREGITDKKESRKDPVIVTARPIGWDKEPGLTNGHAYRYKIVASLTGKDDPSGDSPLSYSKLMYRLKTVVIRSVKNTAPGKVTVKYDKTTSGDSYVLQFGEREDMVGAKTKVVLGANNTSYTIGGLKKGKTYYISIRVRKKVNGIDYYTTFGVPKKIKIEK